VGSKYNKKCVCGQALAANALLVYLERTERVWWLKISFYPAGQANSAPTNPLVGFEGHFEAGQERGHGKEGRGKGNKQKG